ncbi:Ras- protein Rab-1B [Bulinus truncatus]|nr:Ras- protein Rab-1B [Bulinus truncatus]
MPIVDKECAACYKVLVVGDRSVGKTALLRTLANLDFKEKPVPTVGLDFISRIFEVDGTLVQLQIWDSPGHERLRSMTGQHYSGVQGLVLVYDVTDELSFESISYWIRTITNDMETKKSNYLPTPLILVGNKADLISSKKVCSARAEEFADKEMLFGCYETSAKTGENVIAVFHKLAYHITELQNPKLMTSYHPFLIRRTSKIASKPTHNDVLHKRKSKDRKKKKKGDKPHDIKRQAGSIPESQNRLVVKPDSQKMLPINEAHKHKGSDETRSRDKLSCFLCACLRPKGD